MAFIPLNLGTFESSKEPLSESLTKVNLMLSELYTTTYEGDLSAVSQNIVPDQTGTRDLGSAAYKWRNLYLGGGTIYLGSASLSVDQQGRLTINGASISASVTWNDVADKPTLFSGSYSDLSNKPTLAAVATSGSYSDLTNKPTLAAVATSGSYSDLSGAPITGNVTFNNNTINVSNSNPLVITPEVTLSDDLNATNINLTGIITSQASGTPEIISDNEILLDAGTRVELVSSPIKMANLTTAQRDEIIAETGDVIYNSSTNKFQGYVNGVWTDLH